MEWMDFFQKVEVFHLTLEKCNYIPILLQTDCELQKAKRLF